MKNLSLLLFLITFTLIGYSGTTMPFNVDTTIHRNIQINKNVFLKDTSYRHSNVYMTVDSATGKMIVRTFNLIPASGGDSILYADSTELPYYVVLSSTNAPPGSPLDGATYLVGTSPSGAFVGHAKDVAKWSVDDNAWIFIDAVQGDYLYNSTNALTYQFRSGNWVQTAAVPIINNGNTISAGVTIGTNNLKSLTFETNNKPVARFDSLGLLHLYKAPMVQQEAFIDTLPNLVYDNTNYNIFVNSFFGGDNTLLCKGDTTGVRTQLKKQDNNMWTIDSLHYHSCTGTQLYKTVQFKFKNPKIPNGYFADTAIILLRRFQTNFGILNGTDPGYTAPVLFLNDGSGFLPSFNEGDGSGYIFGPFQGDNGDTIGVVGFYLGNKTHIDSLVLNFLIPIGMTTQIKMDQIGLVLTLSPIVENIGIVGDKIMRIPTPAIVPIVNNGLHTVGDTVKFGTDGSGNGVLMEETLLDQSSFPLTFRHQSPTSSRFTSFGSRTGSFFISNKGSFSPSEFGKTNLIINDDGYSVLTTDDDNAFDKVIAQTQTDTMFSLTASSFSDSHKEFIFKHGSIQLAGGMASGGVYQTIDDRRISFTHWYDNGLGGNDTFTYVFPDTIGQAGQVLTTDGTKFLNWRTPSSGATPAYDSTYQIDDTTFVLFKTLSGESDTIIYRLQFPTLYNANGRIETPRTVYTGSSFFLGAEGPNGSYFTLDSATHYSGLYSQVPGYNIHGLFNYTLAGKPVISLGISTNSAPDNGIFIEKDTLWSGIKDINSNVNGQYFINKVTSGMSKFGLKKYNQNNFVIDMTSDAPKVSIGNSTTYTPARASFDVQTSDAIIVPVGNTAARPVTPVQGMIRFNTTTNKFEGYDGSTWVDFH